MSDDTRPCFKAGEGCTREAITNSTGCRDHGGTLETKLPSGATGRSRAQMPERMRADKPKKAKSERKPVAKPEPDDAPTDDSDGE